VLTLLKSWAQPDAFQTLLNERGGRWYNACLRITRDADLAADAVQEALLKAWHRRDDFRGEAALFLIHRIAQRGDRLTRRRKTRPKRRSIPTLHLPSPRRPRQRIQPAGFRKIFRAIQRLSSHERQTFLLKHIEGGPEIAESL
jgi:RNA polymerase sigma-70 factor (ECF subfamily)